MKEKTQSLTNYAYEVLLEKILYLDLPPNSFVDISSLAKELNTSATPLSAALRKLENSGLVKVIPRKGILVAPVELKEVYNAFELRVVLLAFSGRLAAQRITSAQLQEMEGLLKALDQSAGEPETPESYRSFLTLEKRFHEVLDRATTNQILRETNERLYFQNFRLWLLFKEQLAPKGRMLSELRDIYEALRARDPEMAEQKCRHHALVAIQTVRDNFTRFNEFTITRKETV